MKTLDRHFSQPFRQPIKPCNAQAFQEALACWRQWRLTQNLPTDHATDATPSLILDAGCGTGVSSIVLAMRHPRCFVLGVDRSANRLGREKRLPARPDDPTGSRIAAIPANVALIRADLVDFWRLLATEKIRLAQHFLFYPNPWPKPAHLQRRWHAHPVFPTLLTLGGALECRSNWRPYIDELALALAFAGHTAKTETFTPALPCLTPFERKYHASGHNLWILRTSIIPASA
jgi:tRNA G46 methylase TrmB